MNKQQKIELLENELHTLENRILDLLKELQRKDNEIKQLREDIVNHIKIASEYKEQMIIKDNIINELKDYLKFEIAEWQDVDNIPTKARVEEDREILDKIKELESGE